MVWNYEDGTVRASDGVIKDVGKSKIHVVTDGETMDLSINNFRKKDYGKTWWLKK